MYDDLYCQFRDAVPGARWSCLPGEFPGTHGLRAGRVCCTHSAHRMLQGPHEQLRMDAFNSS